MGFWEGVAKSVALWGAVQLSKDENGKPDPYRTAYQIDSAVSCRKGKVYFA